MLIMAGHVHQVNMLDAFGVKEEQCPEENLVEDKVCISETVITVDNAELQGPIGYDQIKQYEESTSMDNIKTEIFEGTEGQNDKVKIGARFSANDIKIEFDNGLLYCEHCETYYVDYCIECGMLVHILNKNALNNADNGARADIPNNILEIQDCFGQTGIYALRVVPACVKFGPFTGLTATECPWEMKGEKFVLDKNKSKHLNWMQYVNPTKNISEHNLHVLQSEDNIYYQSTRQIQAGDELLVYFGKKYGNSLNKIVGTDFVTTTKDIVKDVFACTFCCLGFSTKSLLTKHKTVCVEAAAEKFSIEEVTQCPFCKIHLDSKEFFEHHMTFCCERNARKCILPTPLAKAMTTQLNRRERCHHQIYKCEQCKYRTKYQTELTEHIKQHCKVKIYKCRICNRRFKTKEVLRLHVENIHVYVGGKDDQEHSTTDYRTTHIKVEKSSSQDQKKIFKCSLCVFRAKHEGSLRRHIKAKHLKEFDYKCHSCEYATNFKSNLKRHIKTIHVKEVGYRCDSCEYGTYIKTNLKNHIKTKHLKKFDYKCDSCEYATNFKSDLKRHIKTMHVKEFRYRCDSCEYATNFKRNLKRHIKIMHVKEFGYRCDSCEYGAKFKSNLKRHIKTMHVKEFVYRCDFCEFGTYHKTNLKKHIQTKHFKKFDFKCDSCEYETNVKGNLEVHIKTKHLKRYGFECDSCEFGTYIKRNLKYHIKTKHLKKFDFKCDKCEFETNRKYDLENHIKSKHLKKFDFKCELCDYRTNIKRNLKRHIKSNHQT